MQLLTSLFLSVCLPACKSMLVSVLMKLLKKSVINFHEIKRSLLKLAGKLKLWLQSKSTLASLREDLNWFQGLFGK
jgi:hypothetical protein